MAELAIRDAELSLSLRAPESVRALPPVHREWLRASLREDPRFELDDILADIEQERAQLWAIGDWGGYVQALIVTRLLWYPRCCALEVHLCGGLDMDRWIHLLDDLEQHARNLGCRFVEVRGRRGWERVLPGYGFRGIALAKEL
jgi:hypothetical protein